MAEYVDEADYYAAEPVSDEEKLTIAEHMLMSSPPGQFWEVLTDVRKLLPEGLLDNARAADVAKAYNAKEGVILELGDHCCVLASEGAVGGSSFKDSWGGGEFLVDHIAAQVIGEGSSARDGNGDMIADPAFEEHRQALQDELEAYRASFFSGAEKSAACVFALCDNNLVAYVSAHKHNLRNWWSGIWSGRYTVTIGDGSAEVRGKTSVRGHYFENGNIQLQTSKDFSPKTLPFSDPLSLAKAVTTSIRESESALHEGLEDMYERMGDVTLRNMRRAKPITADRFTWNVAKIRMRNTLKQNASGK